MLKMSKVELWQGSKGKWLCSDEKTQSVVAAQDAKLRQLFLGLTSQKDAADWSCLELVQKKKS